MAINKTTMTDLRIINSELAKGTSFRKFRRDLHISRTSIDIYEKRADESGYPYEELLSKTDKELFDILRRSEATASQTRRITAFLNPESPSMPNVCRANMLPSRSSETSTVRCMTIPTAIPS